jgi:enolase-phosphatase E1
MSQPGLSERGIKLYLLDVEGTTSPISLVYEQLFPYARKHLSQFLRDNLDEPEVRADLALLAEEYETETDPEAPELEAEFASPVNIEEAVVYLNWLMDRDRKSTALKSIQGRIWKSGFLAGELTGTMFPDVPAALRRWNLTAKVAIYSSGSVEAQQLLFRYSSSGDLTPLISAYFDTRVGPKTSPGSYRAIASTMEIAPEELLFVSDVLRELDPAREAGCLTRLSVREGNAATADPQKHEAITSFSQIP